MAAQPQLLARREKSHIEGEALSLFALTSHGEKVEDIRKFIGGSPERAQILAAFDGLVRRTRRRKGFTEVELSGIKAAITANKRPTTILKQFRMSETSLLKIRRRMGVYRDSRYKPPVPDETRTQILNLLRSQSAQCVARALRLSTSRVRAIAAAAGGAGKLRVAGRGRRFSVEQREAMLARIRADGRTIDIRREFKVSDWYVQKMRREIGIHEDRRNRRGWDAGAVKKSLRNGSSLSEIERMHHIQHSVLWKFRKRLGDCEDRRRRKKRILSDTERAAILFDIRAGMSQSSIARTFHLHTQKVRALQNEIGIGACRATPIKNKLGGTL